MVRSSTTFTNPGSPPLYEQFGRPSGSAVARKKQSAAWMKARSCSPIVSLTSTPSIRSAILRVSNRSCSVRLPSWNVPAMAPPPEHEHPRL